MLVVDDVLATGGTAAATCRLVERAGATVAGSTCVLELTFLDGRDTVGDRPLHAIAAALTPALDPARCVPEAHRYPVTRRSADR